MKIDNFDESFTLLLLNKMWESTRIGYCIIHNNLFSCVNKAISDMSKYNYKELIGQKYDFFIFPEDKKNVNAIFKSKYYNQLYEFRILTKDGSVKWVEGINVPISIYEELAILCTMIDVTHFKESELKLKDSENLYRAIFETTGTATIIIEDDMTIYLANSEYEKLTGYMKTDWEGKRKWTDYVASWDIDRLIYYHKQRRIDPSSVPRNYEFDLVDNSGNIRRMYITVSMIPGTKKSIASFTDLTFWYEAQNELKSKTEKLEELNSALKVLLSQREKDREEVERILFSNLETLIFPHIEKLKANTRDENKLSQLEIIETNLKNIVSPFAVSLSSKYKNLTPREIQIANLIKHGLSSKEIANILNVSKSDVDMYRSRIRKKMNLKSRKENLQALLMSL